jgi:hypothetical protein
LPALMLKARVQFFLMMLSVTASSPSPSSCKYNHSPTNNHQKLLFGHWSYCFQGHMSAHLSVVQARDRNWWFLLWITLLHLRTATTLR